MNENITQTQSTSVCDGSKPLVSVIIPLYNVQHYLRETIPTYMSQTYENIEFIYVDDCSSDDSLQLAKELVGDDDRSFFIERKSNGGLSAARNTGLDYANGDYIVFWDSDDTVMPQAVEKCIDVMLENEADIGCYSVVRVNSKGKKYEMGAGLFSVSNNLEALSRWFHNDGVITGAVSKVVSRRLIKENSIRFVEGEVNEDVLYTAEILGAARRVVFCGMPLYYYWEREGSISKSYQGEDLEIVIKHCDQLEAFIEINYPSIFADYEYYRAKSIWGSIIQPLSRRSGRGKAPNLLKRALRDIDDHYMAYRNYLNKFNLGSALIFLVKHDLYWMFF